MRLVYKQVYFNISIEKKIVWNKIDEHTMKNLDDMSLNDIVQRRMELKLSTFGRCFAFFMQDQLIIPEETFYNSLFQNWCDDFFKDISKSLFVYGFVVFTTFAHKKLFNLILPKVIEQPRLLPIYQRQSFNEEKLAVLKDTDNLESIEESKIKLDGDYFIWILKQPILQEKQNNMDFVFSDQVNKKRNPTPSSYLSPCLDVFNRHRLITALYLQSEINRTKLPLVVIADQSQLHTDLKNTIFTTKAQITIPDPTAVNTFSDEIEEQVDETFKRQRTVERFQLSLNSLQKDISRYSTIQLPDGYKIESVIQFNVQLLDSLKNSLESFSNSIGQALKDTELWSGDSKIRSSTSNQPLGQTLAQLSTSENDSCTFIKKVLFCIREAIDFKNNNDNIVEENIKKDKEDIKKDKENIKEDKENSEKSEKFENGAKRRKIETTQIVFIVEKINLMSALRQTGDIATKYTLITTDVPEYDLSESNISDIPTFKYPIQQILSKMDK